MLPLSSRSNSSLTLVLSCGRKVKLDLSPVILIEPALGNPDPTPLKLEKLTVTFPPSALLAIEPLPLCRYSPVRSFSTKVNEKSVQVTRPALSRTDSVEPITILVVWFVVSWLKVNVKPPLAVRVGPVPLLEVMLRS